jgi:soluble lytic murein transglycosylase-like protein
MIRATFGKDADQALCIARHESGFNPKAIGYNHNRFGQVVSRDRGVMQINDKAHPDFPDRLAFDPQANINYAFQMWKQQGNWSAWTTHMACHL